MKNKIDREKVLKEFHAYMSKCSNRCGTMTVWDTYPVIVKDIAVTSVVANGNEILFGDFDPETKVFKCRHSQDDIDVSFILEALEDMKSIDSKKKQHCR